MAVPKLSLITLVYNQAPFLAERIRSIRSQTYQDFEWIVLDDCSTDNSAEILQEQLDGVPQVKRLILHNQNRGVHPSFNEALSWCEGDYVHHAAGDDSCDPKLFEHSISFLDSNSTVGFVHTAYQIIDVEDRILRTVYPVEKTCVQPGNEMFKRLALEGNFICSPSVTFRRSAYESVGGMSNEWIYAGDYELWMKLSIFFDIGYIAEPLVSWRRRPEAISKRGTISVEGATEPYRVINKVFASIPPERQNLQALHKPAIRHVSTLSMTAKSLWWLFHRHNPKMAWALLREADRYDPGVWRDPFSYFQTLHHIVPRAVRRLKPRAGGDMDFLPR